MSANFFNQKPSNRSSPLKQLPINLPETAFSELQALADSSGRSMTDIIRTALSLVKVAIEAETRGNKLAVVNPDGRILKEILLKT